MKDFLKAASGYIIVAVISFITGFSVSLNITTDQRLNIEIKWGQKGLFTLKKLRLADCNLEDISEQDAKSLTVKIKNLSYDNPLSSDLRDLRDAFKGPFKTKDVELTVKFIEENEKITKTWAAACRECQLLNRRISVYKSADPNNLRDKQLEMRIFSIGVLQNTAICDDKTIENNTIWISRDIACEWLKKDIEALPNQIKVKASILGKILTS